MRKHKEKRIVKIIMVSALLFATVFASANSVGHLMTVEAATISVKGKYYQSDARKMKSQVNQFRTGDEAWYYTSDDSTDKTYVSGLGKLSYDYKLERIAMKRAAEISVEFSHTRPNGKDCFSLYPDGYGWKGENIAMGGGDWLATPEKALEAWKETNEPYSGQGHRRNMLNEHFTCIGIACFEVDGVKYWVQEFGNPNGGMEKTKAVNGTRTVKIKK